MRNRSLSLILFFTLLSSFALAQTFEGQLVYERLMKNKKGETSETRRTDYLVKAGKLRINHYDSPSATVPSLSYIHLSDGRLLALAGGDNDRSATDTPLEPLAPGVKALAVVKKTGNTKTIQGKSCVEVVTTYDALEITAWVMAANIDYNALIAPIVGIQEGLLPDGMKGIPLELTFKSNGKVVYTLVAQRITPRKLENIEFQLPAGIRLQRL